MQRKKAFVTAEEYLNKSSDLGNIRAVTHELQQINKVLDNYSTDFLNFCHAGAIDYPNDTLVLYCRNNASFHQINQQIPYIRTYLENKGINFHKILVKVRPSAYQPITNRRKAKKELTDKQKEMLAKFATAINRPDLLKDEHDDKEGSEEEWEIKL